MKAIFVKNPIFAMLIHGAKKEVSARICSNLFQLLSADAVAEIAQSHTRTSTQRCLNL